MSASPTVLQASKRDNGTADMKRRDTGMLGEVIARDFLGKNGYHILETNYRCSEGEIDIIAKQGETLVFIEVRTKRSNQFGTPEESITPTKMERLRAVAAHYGQNREGLPALWRIDVVAIQMDRNGQASRIELIENAVSGA
jgi:putative endonuclease